jgi:hypothetical protein
MNPQTQSYVTSTAFEDTTGNTAGPETEIASGRSRPGDWSNLRALVTGGIVGAFLGAVFFGGYAATSVWICSSSLNCGHWAPIAIVAVSGAAVVTVLGAIAAFALNKAYKLFRVV